MLCRSCTFVCTARLVPGGKPMFTTGEALTQTRRLDLLRRLVTDHDDGDDRPLGMRVAACVLLLYAQPVTRIMTLTTDDIAVDDGAMTLRSATRPRPSPNPSPRSSGACSRNDPPAHQPLALPWPSPRPAAELRHPQPRPARSRCPAPARPRRGHPPARPASTRPGHRRSTRVPPHHHPPPDHPRRRNLEPLRRPQRARPTSRAPNTRQMNTRPYQ